MIRSQDFSFVQLGKSCCNYNPKDDNMDTCTCSLFSGMKKKIWKNQTEATLKYWTISVPFCRHPPTKLKLRNCFFEFVAPTGCRREVPREVNFISCVTHQILVSYIFQSLRKFHTGTWIFSAVAGICLAISSEAAESHYQSSADDWCGFISTSKESS